MFPQNRPRRLRQTAQIRDLVRETRLDPANFILPVFFDETLDKDRLTDSMPGLPTPPHKGWG